MRDRFGLGWRPELAAAIFENVERLDVVEVIADDYFDASAQEIRALRTLRSQVPMVLHGIQLGMASTVPVDRRRLDKMARLVHAVEPDFWSEHLAFVRGGGVEIGHLAAPPRNRSTISGTAENLHRARAGVGCRPLVENVATLIDPPGSDLNEQQWIADILGTGEADLLLDLHNLHANATNFGFDAQDFIGSLPRERIAAIHLAGGRWIRGSGRARLLDDHFHDVPDAVYELLVGVGRHVRLPLTVILERDGDYPPIERLLQQLDAARAALLKGRAAQTVEKEAADVACV